jgi:hypothetical protein
MKSSAIHIHASFADTALVIKPVPDESEWEAVSILMSLGMSEISEFLIRLDCSAYAEFRPLMNLGIPWRDIMNPRHQEG